MVFYFAHMLALVKRVFADGITDYFLFATDNVIVKNSTNFKGQGKICANKFIDIGNDAQIKGTLESGNKILLRERSKITGDVTATGSITLQSQVQVTGEIKPNTTVPLKIVPNKAVTKGSDSITLVNYNTTTLEPGNYAGLHAFSWSKLNYSQAATLSANL